jgi:hypothetical protein
LSNIRKETVIYFSFGHKDPFGSVEHKLLRYHLGCMGAQGHMREIFMDSYNGGSDNIVSRYRNSRMIDIKRGVSHSCP